MASAWRGTLVLGLVLMGAPAAAGTISVAAGGDLQAALDQAAPGDTILLAPGATYVGNFVIRRAVTIRTDGPLPLGRVTPAWAGHLAIVQSPNNGPALATGPSVAQIHLVGLEIGPNGHSGGTSIAIGSITETDETRQPWDVVMDRLLIRGHPVNGQKRGLSLHGSHITVIRSHISDMKLQGQDTQAIWINNGWGPYTITDNYLEASGENIMAGGDTPRIDQLIPSDILIERNTLAKPLHWKLESWTVKNLIEMKSAKRVTIRGNWLEGSWVSGQVGYGILLTPKDQYGKAPWTTVQDVLVEFNVIHEIGEALRILGDDHVYPAVRARNFTIRHNLLVVDKDEHGGSGRCLVVGRAPQFVEFSSNTCIANGAAAFYTYYGGDVREIEGGVFRANVFLHNQYGFSAENFTSGGIGALDLHYPGGVLERNLIGGSVSASRYPYDHRLGLAEFQAQFVNYAGGDFRLTDVARETFTGPDGLYPGADFAGLAAAMTGTAAPSEPAPDSPPAPNSPPVADPQVVTAISGVPLGIVLTGSDPDGDAITFGIVSGPAHGTLTGTAPDVTYTSQAGFAGTDGFTFSVSDDRGGTAMATISIEVSAPPLVVTTSSLPDGRLGWAYSEVLGASGGTPAYTWSRVSGTLPAGVSLSGAGVISGTPTEAGTFTFVVRVTDTAGRTADRSLSLRVAAASGHSGSAPGKSR
jgi:hypothetical protein